MGSGDPTDAAGATVTLESNQVYTFDIINRTNFTNETVLVLINANISAGTPIPGSG